MIYKSMSVRKFLALLSFNLIFTNIVLADSSNNIISDLLSKFKKSFTEDQDSNKESNNDKSKNNKISTDSSNGQSKDQSEKQVSERQFLEKQVSEKRLNEKSQIEVNFEKGYADIVDYVKPTVVSVYAVQERDIQTGFGFLDDFFGGGIFGGNSPFDDFFGNFDFKKRTPKKKKALAAASGFCTKLKGNKLYIATNYHVVEDAVEVLVGFNPDKDNKICARERVKAKVHGTDPKSDLAVLEVDLDDPKIKNKSVVKVVDWGDSDKVKAGHNCIALGYPFAIGFSVSQGIIAANSTGKSNQLDVLMGDVSKLRENNIQHTASINSGNSGGVLVNIKGEVIGVNSAIYTPNGGNVGVGFAIPSNIAKMIIESLIENKRTFRGWLGVTIRQLKYDEAKNLGIIPPAIAKLEYKPELFGAYVSSVEKNGPADKAGIKENDIIIAFDGKPIDENNSLPNLVNDYKISEKANVLVLRQSGQNWVSKDIQVNIGDYADFEKSNKQGKLKTPEGDANSATTIEEIGVVVWNNESKVVVKQLLENYTANELFSFEIFRVGDIIEKANETQITSSNQLANIVKEFKQKFPNRNMTFTIKRPLSNNEYSNTIITIPLKTQSEKYKVVPNGSEDLFKEPNSSFSNSQEDTLPPVIIE